MGIQTLVASDTNGNEEIYAEDGSYEGIVTDKRTGKKYKIEGNDWDGDKSKRFRFAQGDSLSITELEADGKTEKKDGLFIQGVHYHEHVVTHGRGLDAWSEYRRDNVEVFPNGRKACRSSHVAYLLSGGLARFGGFLKGIYSKTAGGDWQEVEKKDKFYGAYKALYEKNYAGLVKGLIKASQKIREQAMEKQISKEQIMSAKAKGGKSR